MSQQDRYGFECVTGARQNTILQCNDYVAATLLRVKLVCCRERQKFRLFASF